MLNRLVWLVLAGVLGMAGVEAIGYTTNFEPPHPCIYMTQADVQRMKDNISQYTWAQTLWGRLQAQADGYDGSGGVSLAIDRKILNLGIAYQISGNAAYGEKGYQALMNGSISGIASLDLQTVAGWGNASASEVVAGYDLLYPYIKANHPGDIVTMRNQFAAWLGSNPASTFGQICDDIDVFPACVIGMVSILLGDDNLINGRTAEFKQFVDVSLGNEGIMSEEDIRYNVHTLSVALLWCEGFTNLGRATSGARGFDAWNWTSTPGASFKTWPLNYVYATMPNNWCIMNSNTPGAYYNSAMKMDRTPLFEYVYTRLNDPWAGWLLKNGNRDPQNYDNNPFFVLGQCYPPLTHGTDLSSVSSFPGSNLSLHRDGTGNIDGRTHGGVTILHNGSDTDAQTATSLSIMMQHYAGGGGRSGQSRDAADMRTFMYGKGEMMGFRVWGGNKWYMNYKFPGTFTSPYSPGGITKLADINNPEIKLVTMDDEGQLADQGKPCSGNTVRTIGVTNDYFIDFLELNGSAPTITGFYEFVAPVGGTAGSVSQNGTIWTATSNKIKTVFFGESGDNVTFTPSSMLLGSEADPPWTYTINWSCMQFYVSRANNTRTMFRLIYEPHTGTSVISQAERMSQNNSNVTSLKLTANGWVDYLVFAHTPGAYTATIGSESVSINGRYGYIRRNASGTLVVRGSVTSHNIPGTPINEVVATPAISPNGGTFATTVQVTLSCATAGAEIHYTTDGSTPMSGSAVYTAPITLSASATVKAIGIKSGMDPSAVTSATFTQQTPTVATPTISPHGGSYSGSIQVTLTCATSGADIHYTTDGSDPTSSSPHYSSAITLTTTVTLKAKAFKAGSNASGVASATFTNTDLTVAAPVISPNGGYFDTEVTVSITCATSGAAIYYTSDGSTPTQSSSPFTVPITITGTSTIKARAFKSGLDDSPVTSATFTKGTSSVLIDDFEGGPKLNWAPKTASRWGVDADNGDDSYHLRTTDHTFDYTRPGEWSLLDHGEFTEYELEVDARSPEASNGTADFGIIFGFKDTDNFYYVTFVRWQNNVSIYKVSGGTRTTLQSVDEAYTFDTNYHKLKLVVKDNTITLYLDGVEKCSVSETVPQGAVGLCTLDDEAYFDDFKLTDLNGLMVRVLPGRSVPNGPERLLLQMEGDQVGFTLLGAVAGNLVLYGPTGQRLYSLTCRANRTEHYSVAGLPSGVYYYGINTGGATRYGMMVIVK